MIALKECQQTAVDALFEKYLESKNQIHKEIYFQAPTGAGKTLILCTLCDKIVQYNKKCIILFVSISTGDIQVQNYDKSCLYQSKNNYKYTSYLIKSPSKNNTNSKLDSIIQIPLRNHYVYFIGSSSYKDKAKLREELILELFLDNAKKDGYEIIYIRDEAHIGTKKETSVKNLDQLLNKYANLTYYVSATLEQIEHKINVQIQDIDAINDGLIKSNQILYSKINSNITSEELYEKALEEFKDVKKQYEQLNYGINPCMLIQIKNTKKEDKDKEQALIRKLASAINNKGLKYLVYTEENKKESNTKYFNNKSNLTQKEKKLITANDSNIDVIIFKVALATGWDIPRANMLLQLREIYSDTLDVQTIGRIRRNPLARVLNNNEKILDNYYIYSNVPKKKSDEYQTLKHNEQVVVFRNFTTVILEKIEQDKNIQNQKKELVNVFEELIKKFKVKTQFSNNSSSKNTYHKLLAYVNDIILINNSYELQLDLLFLTQEHDQKVSLISDKFINVFEVEDTWNKKILSYNDEAFLKFINEFIAYYANQEKMNPYAIKLFLLDHRYEDIFNFLIEQYNLSKKDQQYKYIQGPIVSLPNVTIQYLNKQKEKNEYKLKENLLKYLEISYWIPGDEEKNKDVIYNDSAGETSFIKKIIEFFKNISKEKNTHLILFKNYLTNSDFRYEYIDKQPFVKKRSHYPDFVVEKNNDIYVCEVKSQTDDYDYSKTQELEEAYQEYSRLNDYHYLLLRWNNKYDSFSWRHYYHGNLLQEEQYQHDLNEIFK